MHTISNSLATLLCFAALIAAAHAQDHAQEWPTFRHDIQRTGAQPNASNLSDPNKVGTLSVKWSFPSAPPAVAGPFVDTFAGHDQQHFAYLSEGGAIWDAFFFAGDNKWHLQ
ncbi:MAG: hypothetical protein ACREDD_08600, partial [Methylocella sp.]